jgi:hypothetical protein
VFNEAFVVPVKSANGSRDRSIERVKVWSNALI